MKKIIIFLLIVLIDSSCSNIYSVHKKIAARYQRKFKTASHRKKFSKLHTPHQSGISENKQLDLFHAVEVNTANIPGNIYSYMDSNGLSYPLYFIMRVSELINFLNSKQSSPYLHFYFSIDSTNSVNMVMCGANSTNGLSGPYTDKAITPDTVFGYFLSSSKTGVIPDKIIDGDQPLYTYPTPQLVSFDSRIPIKTATRNINNFEQKYNQFALSYSFLIDTSDLGTFLNTPSMQVLADGSQSNAQYIQIYLAYQSGNPDSSTVIIAGLDNNAKHVYFSRNDGKLNVFNTACPCPYCDVAQNLFNTPIQQ